MKVLTLLLIVFLALPTPSDATPAPVRSKTTKAEKSGQATSSQNGQKKSVKSKERSKTVTQKYKVRSGDSLYTIARRHGMKLTELQRLNNLKSSRLKIGQILLVSGKIKKSGQDQADETAADSGQIISQIALASEDGSYADALPEAGVEPIARTYLSIPYRYGAQSRKSTDCSGFVQQVFREFDIKLPRTAREQFKVGSKIERANLSSGDLLFFRTRARKKYPTHVGIYLGNGKMIHASSRSRKVVISDVNHPYYVKRYVGAKRTANFLPGEIDLEMLARQVTGMEADAPLAEAIVADVREEEEPSTSALDSAVMDPRPVMEAGYDERSEDIAVDGDDIDSEVEPEPDIIISAPPQFAEMPLYIDDQQSGEEALEIAASAEEISPDSVDGVDVGYGATPLSSPFSENLQQRPN